MERALSVMTDALSRGVGDLVALYLYGSAAMEDFRPGWSDIDILCLTEAPLPEERARSLVTLRQSLVEQTGDGMYRSFEGAIAALPEFLSGQFTRIVYWGTGGERMTNRYDFDAFSRLNLMRYGRLLAGREIRDKMTEPTPGELRDAVARHLASIRQCAKQTGPSLYSCGWLLDIARCLYTLETGEIIAKTAAGEWALRAGLCPVEADLRRTLAVRRAPRRFRDDPETLAWLAGLGPAVQRFADVLEARLQA